MQYLSIAVLLAWYIMMAPEAHALATAYHVRIVHARKHLWRLQHESKICGGVQGFNGL